MGVLAGLTFLEQAYERSGKEFDQIVFFLKSKDAAMMTESELEREIEKRTRELMRMFLQEHIGGRGCGICEEGVRGVDGVDRTRVRLQGREIVSIFGTVEETRAGYGYPGASIRCTRNSTFRPNGIVSNCAAGWRNKRPETPLTRPSR